MNAKFFSDTRARRLPYTPKRKKDAAGSAANPTATRPRRPSPNLNPLQAALLERLEQAGFPGRFWPLRRPPVSRIYFNFFSHVQIFISFTNPETLTGPRLQLRFLTESEHQAEVHKLLEEQFAPAVEICRQLTSERQDPPCLNG